MSRSLDAIDSEIREVKGRTFKNLGDLLIEIVDRKLFQDRGFTNVEDYFQSEPHLPSARQAFRLIAATRFSRQLPDSVQQPKSERQVRPLLGKRKEESRLLWTIATLVAAERRAPLDGKLVANVVKDYENGRLQEFVPRACELLGEPATSVDEEKRSVKKHMKRVGGGSHKQSGPDAGHTLLQTASDVHYLTAVLCGAWGIPYELVDANAMQFAEQSGKRVSGTKRQRTANEFKGEIQNTTTLLTQTLRHLMDLCQLMGIAFVDSNCLTAETELVGMNQEEEGNNRMVSQTPLPVIENAERSQQSTQRKQEPKAPSSEDEMTVAEALINLSNARNSLF